MIFSYSILSMQYWKTADREHDNIDYSALHMNTKKNTCLEILLIMVVLRKAKVQNGCVELV